MSAAAGEIEFRNRELHGRTPVGRLRLGRFDFSQGSVAWRQDAAFRDFLVTGRYKTVTDSFGRAEIQNSMPARATQARLTSPTRRSWKFIATPI